MFEKLDKKKKNMSPVEKDAKTSVLEGLRGMAEEMMGGKLKNLKKVTVASDSPEGLKSGLMKAEEIMGGAGEESEDGSLLDADDSVGAPDEDESMSEEEINQKLEKLMSLKQKMKGKV